MLLFAGWFSYLFQDENDHEGDDSRGDDVSRELQKADSPRIVFWGYYHLEELSADQHLWPVGE
jgi:hypothetical protein